MYFGISRMEIKIAVTGHVTQATPFMNARDKMSHLKFTKVQSVNKFVCKYE